MRWPENLRHLLRRPEEPIGETLAAVCSQVEDVTNALFEMTLLARYIPDQAHIDATAQKLADELLAPAVSTFAAKGKPEGEIEAYRSLLASQVLVTFQRKWDQLARLNANDVVGVHQ